MRALLRIATPAGIAAALTGCTYPFEDYLPRATDAGLASNQDTSVSAETGSVDLDSGVFETASDSALDTGSIDTGSIDTGSIDTGSIDTAIMDTFSPDTAMGDTSKPDTCVCVKTAGGKCKEWSPPGCGDD